MKIIVVSKRHGGTRSYTLGTWARAVLSLCIIGIPVGGAGLAWQHFSGEKQDLLTPDSALAWQDVLEKQENAISEAKTDVDQK